MRTTCPQCDAAIETDNEPMLNEIVRCQDCSVELEVVNTEPVALVPAPPPEEDFGE
jgi:alpha-aminoadipate/glutamate carrier protein LysW